MTTNERQRVYLVTCGAGGDADIVRIYARREAAERWLASLDLRVTPNAKRELFYMAQSVTPDGTVVDYHAAGTTEREAAERAADWRDDFHIEEHEVHE